MTTKGTPTVDSTGSLSLAQLPPQISLASPLLASIIRLPPDPLIAYTIFEPSDSLDPSLHLSAIESARISLISDSRSILKSLLFTVKILPRLPLLYVFAISSSGQRSPPHDALLNLKFDGLVSSTSSTFTLKGLYPCSTACSITDEPCPNCLADPFDPLDPPFLPRPLIDLEVSRALMTYSQPFDARMALSLSEQMGPPTGAPGGSTNPEIDLLPLARSAAVTPGSPIRLLPFNTPAYYLGPYTGPTNALTTQFEDSLRGLGVGGWKDLFHKPIGKHLDGPSYVTAWVAVQNRRGEEKGISVVWPLSLCLSFLPESPQARQGLSSLPELPTTLRLHSSIPPPSSTTANAPLISPQDIKPALSAIPTIPPVGLPLRAAVYSARSLQSLPSRIENTVDDVSLEVSRFVDYVAKEREKERERIKRERDNHTNPISSSQPLIIHTNGLEREQTASPPVMDVIVDDNQEQNKPPSTEACKLLDGLDTSVEDKTQDTLSTQEQSPEVTNPYEIYSSFNSSWAQAADQFSTLEIDYEMGFGMEINTMDRGAGVGDEMGITTDLDNIYGVLTDDDFNFFDRPSLDENYLDQVPSVSLFRDQLVPQHGAIPLVEFPTSPTNGAMMHYGHAAGKEQPVSPSPSPWASTPRVDPMTLIDSTESVSSPSISPHSTPSTPQVIPILRRPPPIHGSSIFDPVWFAPMHRTSDHKYASGKFSLPKQPAVQAANAPQHNASWRFRYNDVTDPRISVVRRLTGPSSFPIRNCAKGENVPGDEWANALSEGEGEGWSDVESIDGRSAGFVEAADISVLLDRPRTPLPQFTPLGPSLVDCQFHHSHLLPLSHPLHSPSSAMTTTGLQDIVPTISAPTPVSPPAMLGEKLRSWEAAAGLLIREVMENSLWAWSWQVNNHYTFHTTSYTSSTCQGDVSQLASALGTLDDNYTCLEMGTLFDLAVDSLQPNQGDISSSLQSMEPPLFSVGKGNSIINVLPPVIRFWEKTGLYPVGGQKNVNAFVLYEGEGTEVFEHATRWFKRVSIAYTSKNFGSHGPGCFTDGSSPGSVVEVRFDSIRRFLPTFTSKIQTSEHLVFYIITPLYMMTLASSNFRQVLSAAKRALKGSPTTSTLFQFVPESMVSDSVNGDQGIMSTFVTSVYDRLLKSVGRGMSRPLFTQEESIRTLVQSPAFVLSRPQYPRPIFLRQAPARSLDVMDRHLLLHVGYSTSTCGKWIMASCIDQRGGSHDLGFWLKQPDVEIPEEFVVNKVWEFAMSFMKRTDIEWRVAFSKAGPIDEREMDAWHSKVSLGISIRGASPIHVSLLSVVSDASWTLLSPANPSQGFSGLSKATPSMRFQDTSSTTYALIHTTPVTLFSPLSTGTSFAIENTVPELDEVVAPGISIRPLSTATLIRVPTDTDYTSVSMLRVHLFLTLKSAGSHLHISDEDTHLDIIHNFHELTVLGDARWNLGARANPILPFHLSCLEVMDRVLAEELRID
ncbi:hypothetical protein BDM02DRAFT_3191865 [Thelephora ganbajun]|uniref:Uncharacterized protein n=1 Tax=Thelephora ganbajun TaxID=370292 RepID=A0ACB6Z194_THEGA|nr:hypothetical protein BDM02DRAFT_3191865 [Thelephora ganbajun]